MQKLSKEQLVDIAKERVKSRLLSEVRIPAAESYWEDSELVACWDKSTRKGILVIELDELYLTTFELGGKVADSKTGRTKPVICDLCYTWQQGGKAATITCSRERDRHTFTYLCCADLRCSLHIRSETAEGTLSRAHIHEDLTPEQRTTRMRQRLYRFISTLELLPVTKF